MLRYKSNRTRRRWEWKLPRFYDTIKLLRIRLRQEEKNSSIPYTHTRRKLLRTIFIRLGCTINLKLLRVRSARLFSTFFAPHFQHSTQFRDKRPDWVHTFQPVDVVCDFFQVYWVFPSGFAALICFGRHAFAYSLAST